MANSPKPDQRYEHVLCLSCRKPYQRIDFGCAVHVYSCTDFEAAVTRADFAGPSLYSMARTSAERMA